MIDCRLKGGIHDHSEHRNTGACLPCQSHCAGLAIRDNGTNVAAGDVDFFVLLDGVQVFTDSYTSSDFNRVSAFEVPINPGGRFLTLAFTQFDGDIGYDAGILADLFLDVTIPEPGTLVVLGGGPLVLLRRRKRE